MTTSDGCGRDRLFTATTGVFYVAGFLYDNAGRVALVRKHRPPWQAGRLNGVGGKIEPGETATDAMRRDLLPCWSS